MDPVYELLERQARLLRVIPSYGERVNIETPILGHPPVRQIYLSFPLAFETGRIGDTSLSVRTIWTAYTIPLADEGYVRHGLAIQTAMIQAIEKDECLRADRIDIELREPDTPALAVSIATDTVLHSV